MKDIDDEINGLINRIYACEKAGTRNQYEKNIILSKFDYIENELIKQNNEQNENYKMKIDNLRLKRRIQKKREESLVKALISILDSIEWMFPKALIFSDNKFKKTIDASKKLIARELYNIKLIEIPKEGELYNDNYHICLGYKKDENLADNQILQVIKKGYIYRDKVIRQAEVIVVNNEIGDGLSNEHNRY